MSGGKVKVCPVCGKEFVPRANSQRYCGRACTYASQRKENSELRVKRPKPETSVVKIKVIKRIPLYPEVVPQMGIVYEAQKCVANKAEPFYIIPDLGGKKIVVRKDECAEVK